jgi:hypothetical protein
MLDIVFESVRITLVLDRMPKGYRVLYPDGGWLVLKPFGQRAFWDGSKDN